jgi:SAM-dependent methyltransferase
MHERLEALCQERSDVQVLRFMVSPDKMLEWAHSIGASEDEQLAALLPPFPPLELRNITAAPRLPEFLWTGLSNLGLFVTLYEKFATPEAFESSTVLDFGCGCGRMVRFLNSYSDRWSVHACDVNPDLVNWCNQNLDNVTTTQTNIVPPTPFNDQLFNLIYSLSVFTHLPESRVNSWLNEIYRILAPNGIFITTTHGTHALEVIKNSKIHQDMFQMNQQQVVEIIEKFDESPFVYLQYKPEVIAIANAGEDYGNAFISSDYILKHWNTPRLKVLEHLPGGLLGWQDITILQRIEP